ncbi:MAG: hypothetical protein DHS20C18_21060 [Saprospiraceae bacterium]|nr:MAG: hypothetical protein DHS20C18_21060 [Saprospiraceae bacterium]
MFLFRTLTIVLLSIFSFQLAIAQESTKKERERQAVQAIIELQKGVLILRLPSESKKIKAMQQVLAKDINDADRTRLEKQIESTRLKNEQENRLVVDAFDNYFSFVPIYVIYDTATIALLEGRSGDYLLDTKLNPISLDTIRGKSFYIARLGSTDQANTTGAESIIIMDKNLNDLQSPFPYAIKLHSLGYTLNTLLIPKEAFEKRMEKVASKLNKNLEKFYDNVKD